MFNQGYTWFSMPIDTSSTLLNTGALPGLCVANQAYIGFNSVQVYAPVEKTVGCYSQPGISSHAWLPPGYSVVVSQDSYHLLLMSNMSKSMTWTGMAFKTPIQIKNGFNRIPYHHHHSRPINEALSKLLVVLNSHHEKHAMTVMVSASPRYGYAVASYSSYLGKFMANWNMEVGNGYHLWLTSSNTSTVITFYYD